MLAASSRLGWCGGRPQLLAPGLLALLMPLAVVEAVVAEAVSETVLFAFDDGAIPWRDNLHLVLAKAEKHPGNPVLRRGPAGSPDHGHAILYGTVLYDGGKFRMWYLGLPDTTLDRWRETRWRPMCYAESSDGVHWVKPSLGLVEIHGSRQNNACLIESDQHYLTRVDDFLSVLYEPDDPDPTRRYKCAYIAHMPYNETVGGLRSVDTSTGRGAEEPVRVEAGLKLSNPRTAMMVTAVSADGLRWKVQGDRPAIDEKFEVSALYRAGHFYYAAGQQISPWVWRADGSPTGRSMVVYRSADFRHWSTAKTVSFQRPGQVTDTPIPGQQTHMGAGIWNRGNVYVGLYGAWQDGPSERPAGASRLWGTHIDLGLVVSSDGMHFREPVPGHRVISRGPAGSWDATALLQGHAFANVGDRTYLWYSHWDTSGQLRNMDIGLATLRRDGFGALQLHDQSAPGFCETFTLPPARQPRELLLNLDGVSSSNPLRVELLDERGQVIPGFSGNDAAVVANSSTQTRVVWPATGTANLPLDQAFGIRVRFAAGSLARLYCGYVAPVPSTP